MEGEREVYIAPGRGRERYWHGDRARYGLADEDSSLVQCFDHWVFIMELTRWGRRGKWKWEEAWLWCERRLREGREKREKFCWKFGGEMKWNRGVTTVITQPNERCDNALVRGPWRHLIYHICHWVSVFNFWKHQNPVFTFHHPHPKFWVFESWK